MKRVKPEQQMYKGYSLVRAADGKVHILAQTRRIEDNSAVEGEFYRLHPKFDCDTFARARQWVNAIIKNNRAGTVADIEGGA